MKRSNFLFLSIILGSLFVIAVVWADTNGIWHKTEDIQGGVFGGDEQDVSSSYSFVNPVMFNQDVTIGTQIKVNTIKSYTGGSVVVILG